MLAITGIAAAYTYDLNPLAGSTTVTYTITNPGNVALSGTVAAGVRTWFGIQTGAYAHAEVSELLPGATRTLEIEIGGVGQLGFLNPYVSLQPVADDPAFTPVVAAQSQRDTVVLAVPWLVLAVVVLVLGFFLWRRWSRRRDDKRAAEWVAYTEEEARRKATQSDKVLVGAAAVPDRSSS